MDDGITVELVPAWTTWPLRQEVLRPGRAVRDCIYPGEDDPRAAHGAALRKPVAPGGDLTVVAVGVVMPEAPSWPDAPSEPDSAPGEGDRDAGWRIRGMATRADSRGQGLGGQVLDLLIGHVRSHGGGLLWCNARTPALSLYERAGFQGRGEVFELPEIGPHLVMWRTVEPNGAPGAGAAAPEVPLSP